MCYIQGTGKVEETKIRNKESDCLFVGSFFRCVEWGIMPERTPRNEEPDHALELKGLLKAKKVFRSVEMHAVYCGH